MVTARHLFRMRRSLSWRVAGWGAPVAIAISLLIASTHTLPESPAVTQAAAVSEGQRLFDHETFGGNGRTCRTCHSGTTGRSTRMKCASGWRRTRPTPCSVMTAWTIFSAAPPDRRPRNDPDRARTPGGGRPRR